MADARWRIGQGRARGGLDAQVLQLALTTAQPTADLPQGMGAPELAERQNSMATNCPQQVNPRA
jgi:hypothetical protein